MQNRVGIYGHKLAKIKESKLEKAIWSPKKEDSLNNHTYTLCI